ncbi:trigger factor [Filimonas zeae]|uniref:Trigger factor n=1 Tax=Filimonas zeae TaxID=1737353 RepID=A0A917J4K5_9BACT|nr:trigger factor [Filimonas zeae]MDR6341210.1 trigger factor [Filimonas zeae]GGH76784.1 trigger factor [Filimonas zeae]
MATITRENIALLTDKLTVTLAKDDYFPAFEQSLKKYAKTVNIPGFRKGMVPSGVVKKMYGQSIFTEEVLRSVEKELNSYMSKEQLDIFAQPLPLDSDARALDMNNLNDYVFAFEIGLKPDFNVNVNDIKVTRYKINVTDEMINEEVNRLQIRNGKMTDPETVTSEDHVVNVDFKEVDATGAVVEGGVTKSNSLLVKYFTEPVRAELQGKKKDDVITIQLSKAFETKEREWVLSDLGLSKDNAADADKYFQLTITKVGLIEKAELNEEFFNTVYPGRDIKTEADFRAAVKAEIENYYGQQSSNQVHDQIYHHLVDHTNMEFPAEFLKRWLQTGGEQPKTAEEAEAEYPNFTNQLKWTLVTNKLINENKISVDPSEIKEFAKEQIKGYMGGQDFGDAPWMDEYTNRMLKDQKFVENTYFQLQTTKLFRLLETQVSAKEEAISAEAFAEKLHHHHH